MEISKTKAGTALEVRISGRLDAYWADHLAASVEESVRAGEHNIRLHCADLEYLSSAGIRILLKFHKQLRAIQGSFFLVSPSDIVRNIVNLAGFSDLLMAESSTVMMTVDQLQALQSGSSGGTKAIRPDAAYEVFELNPAAGYTRRILGDPGPLAGARFGPADCRPLAVHDNLLALGAGAFGTGFDDCRERFGEFIALCGAAAYLPAGGGGVSDFQTSTGAFQPEVKTLYGIACDGSPRWLFRFTARGDSGAAGLSSLVEAALDITRLESAAIVIAAETAGLIGASLRRSPALGPEEGAPFAHPAIRRWLSYAGEPAHARTVALAAGVAARNPPEDLAPLLRPLGPAGGALGHFHAAVFPYRPLQKGRIDLVKTVQTLFDGESVLNVLHLLADPRPLTGAGESEFIRGAIWVGPLH